MPRTVTGLLLALATASSPGAAVAAPLVNTANAAVDHGHIDDVLDVVILGAGMAGVAAASELLAHKATRFVVLEAAGRTGGRVQSIPFGDPAAAPPLHVERGANWVHGTGPRNALWSIAQGIDLQTSRVPGATYNLSGYGVYDHGERVDARASVAALGKVWNCTNRTSQTSTEDMSVRAAMSACGWDEPKADGVDRVLEWELTAGDATLPPEKEALWGTVPDDTYVLLGADDHLVVDQRARGYAATVDAVPRALTGRPDAAGAVAARTLVNTTVVQIDWSGTSVSHGTPTAAGAVVVVTQDGRRLAARHVISTLPLGVLRHGVAPSSPSPPLFEPPVPAAQAEGLLAYTSGNMTKIFAQWAEPWWPVGDAAWLSTPCPAASQDLNATAQLAPCAEFHNFDMLIPGSKTVFLLLVDPASSVWEPMDDAAARAALVAWLNDAYPPDSAMRRRAYRSRGGKGSPGRIPEPTAFHMTRHALDPLQRGAYSTWSTSFSVEHFNAAFAPLKVPRHGRRRANATASTVRFAGEAVCLGMNGYLHGALFSGQFAARQVLRDMGLLPHVPPSICDEGLLGRRRGRIDAVPGGEPSE